MILCVGELLADMMGTPIGGSPFYQLKAGGAPFNVACAASKLGAKVGFIGSVGYDNVGNYLVEFASRFNFEYLNIHKDEKRNTTLAFVDNDPSGERYFCFYRKNTADPFLMPVSDEIISKSDIICLGSLMLSEEEGVRYALSLTERAKRIGKRVAFDVNLRKDIFSDELALREAYGKIIACADIVKFSEDEVQFFGEEFVSGLRGDKLVLITYGSRGASYKYKEIGGSVPSVKVTPVDTTGAGDAFFGAMLYCLADKTEYDETLLNEALSFACKAGAINTLKKGAVEGLPTLEEVESF